MYKGVQSNAAADERNGEMKKCDCIKSGICDIMGGESVCPYQIRSTQLVIAVVLGTIFVFCTFIKQ